jgi:hypothetical protein
MPIASRQACASAKSARRALSRWINIITSAHSLVMATLLCASSSGIVFRCELHLQRRPPAICWEASEHFAPRSSSHYLLAARTARSQRRPQDPRFIPTGFPTRHAGLTQEDVIILLACNAGCIDFVPISEFACRRPPRLGTWGQDDTVKLAWQHGVYVV